MNSRKVHLNDGQQLYVIVRPNRTVAIIGRGWGKTFGLQSTFSADNMIKMPRSTGRIGAYTYEGLMKNIIPGLIQGWQEIYGWIENVHFFVGKWAPENYGWKRPYFETRGDSKHLIHVYNGSVAQLASMDRSINNGANIDWMSLDEARFIRRAKVAEMIPAMRGNVNEFGHLSNYQSLLMTSDMPQVASEKWLLDYEDEHTQDLIDQILAIQEFLQPKYEAWMSATGEYKQQLRQMINRFELEINDLRMEATLYFEGSSLDNIHVLGRRTIEKWKADMTDDEFAVAVLNRRRDKIVNGFYAALDPERDSYDGATRYDAFDQIENPHKGYTRDCRMDADYFEHQELYIAFDHNAAINCMVIGQTRPGNEGHIINSMYVLQPYYLKHLLERFIQYYSYARPENKRLTYYYDSTSIKDNSRGTVKEKDEVINVLRKAGWKVKAVFVGKTIKHYDKYKLWNAVLMRTDRKLISIKYNRVNCMQMEKSMLNVDVKKVGDEYRKDKSTEQKNYKTNTYKVAPEDAPHFSEATDTLVVGWVEKLNHVGAFSDIITY